MRGFLHSSDDEVLSKNTSPLQSNVAALQSTFSRVVHLIRRYYKDDASCFVWCLSRFAWSNTGDSGQRAQMGSCQITLLFVSRARAMATRCCCHQRVWTRFKGDVFLTHLLALQVPCVVFFQSVTTRKLRVGPNEMVHRSQLVNTLKTTFTWN